MLDVLQSPRDQDAGAKEASQSTVQACLWLIDSRIGEHWQPTRSNMMLNADDNKVFVVVDPAILMRGGASHIIGTSK